jgi:hypothetical protein
MLDDGYVCLPQQQTIASMENYESAVQELSRICLSTSSRDRFFSAVSEEQFQRHLPDAWIARRGDAAERPVRH